jgi:Ca2+-binding RTX toxin-like protein
MATDAAENLATSAFAIDVVDTTPPTLTLPSHVTVEATGADGAVVTFVASARDAVSGEVAVVLSAASGSTFPLGATTVTARATDGVGNVGQGEFVVEVVDTTAPTLVLPGPLVVEATSPTGAVATFAATAVDAVSGSVPVVLAPPSGSTFALGPHTVAARAVDAAGNVAVGAFSVTVVDTTRPIVIAPPNVTITTCARPDIGQATATDAAGAVVITNDAPSLFVLGTVAVTWRAVDGSGNAATAKQTVTVELGDDASCCPLGTKVIVGTNGPDVLRGTKGSDCILGRGGNDVIDALDGNDFISGGEGVDTIAAGAGNDLVMGGPGTDIIDASLGDDRVYGGPGIDVIAAGPGSDVVDGGPDHDVCAVPPDGHDVVTGCP